MLAAPGPCGSRPAARVVRLVPPQPAPAAERQAVNDILVPLTGGGVRVTGVGDGSTAARQRHPHTNHVDAPPGMDRIPRPLPGRRRAVHRSSVSRSAALVTAGISPDSPPTARTGRDTAAHAIPLR